MYALQNQTVGTNSGNKHPTILIVCLIPKLKPKPKSETKL